MTIRDLIPWKNKSRVPVRRQEDRNSLRSIHDEMNRVFDSFFDEFPLSPWEGFSKETFSPRVDISETDKEVKLTAELPGMAEKDIDVTLSRGVLTIKGEKKEEHEENKKGVYRVERSYGSFQRSVPLPSEADDSRANAEFSKGVLTVKIPKTEEAQKLGKKIEVKRG